MHEPPAPVPECAPPRDPMRRLQSEPTSRGRSLIERPVKCVLQFFLRVVTVTCGSSLRLVFYITKVILK